MEETGVPGIAIVTTPFRNTGKAMVESWGKPGYPFLDTPHPLGNLTQAEPDQRRDAPGAVAAPGEAWPCVRTGCRTRSGSGSASKRTGVRRIGYDRLPTERADPR